MYLVKIHDYTLSFRIFNLEQKDSEWMNEILSSFYDLHLNRLINSFMHS